MLVDETGGVLFGILQMLGEEGSTYGPENPFFWAFVLFIAALAYWKRKTLLHAPEAVRKAWRKGVKARDRRREARGGGDGDDDGGGDSDSDDDREARAAVVVSFEEEGDKPDARGFLERALAKDPDDRAARSFFDEGSSSEEESGDELGVSLTARGAEEIALDLSNGAAP